MNIDDVFEEFQKDVRNHTLRVLKDDGVYRHLRFSDGTSIYRFDIITWPGSLCISGDMGCRVFERLEDMFEFFDSKDLKINPDYWSEDYSYSYIWRLFAIVWGIQNIKTKLKMYNKFVIWLGKEFRRSFKGLRRDVDFEINFPQDFKNN